MSEEDINFEAEAKEAEVSKGQEEMTMDDLESQYVKHPEVSEEIEIDVVKALKDKNITATAKDGSSFSTALSGVDYKITLKLKGGKTYTPPCWEVWNKIRTIMRDKKTMEVKVKILHKVDGSLATKKVDEIAKLNDLNEEEATTRKQEAMDAKKNKKLYEVTAVV